MTEDVEAQPFVVEPGEGTAIRGPLGGTLAFEARGEQTGGRLTVFENVIPPGDGPPHHVHRVEDEAWVVLEGTLRFRLGEDVRDAPAGSFVFAPRGTAHSFVNVTEMPARVLVIFTPGGIEQFFDHFAALPPEAVNPGAYVRLGDAIGMDVVGPPIGRTST